MICTQSGSFSSAPPVATISSIAGQQVRDLREPERDALEPGLAQVERRRVERQPVHRAFCVLMPARAALAAE